MIQSIKRKIYTLKRKYFSHAILVEGILKGTKSSSTCLFIDNSRFSEFMIARMYEEPPSVLRKSILWIPGLVNRKYMESKSFDLCIAVLPKVYEPKVQGLYNYKCTEFVRQVIDVSGSWDDVRNRFSKTKRKISNNFTEKFGLDYRISNDLHEFDYFYHHIFVPHVSKRFKTLSEIDSYQNMKRFFMKGGLLLVTKSNEVVAGSLFYTMDDALVIYRTGVLGGNDSLIKSGAQQALYYFQIKYAMDLKLKLVDTMLSSSFLNDGVFNNKRQWGAGVYPDISSNNWIYFFKAQPSEMIANFFEINPLIVYSSEGLKGVIGVSDATHIPIESNHKLTYRYHTNGLDEFSIVTATDTFELKNKN